MALAPGVRLGPYEIVSALGAGGMGEVYDQEVNSVLVADVVQRADMRVVEAGDGLRFTLEPFAAHGVARQVRRQDLDRGRAVARRLS